MPQEKSKIPPESPELTAKRLRLVAALAKEAQKARGTAQPLLQKMHALFSSSEPGKPFNPALYDEVKMALVAFARAPVIPPPAILQDCVDFMQEKQVSLVTGSR